MPDAAPTYQANLYPRASLPAAGAPVLGVCLSGGGSRALSCALGQLSALDTIPSPVDPARKLLDEVSYISSVSGGSWASVAYTFLPPTISDTDFLIAPLEPASLTRAIATSMNPRCLGIVPQQFNAAAVADFLELLWQWGFFNPFGPDMRNWFWIAAVGELVLKPFGLYTASYSPASPYLLPSRSFSESADYITEYITPHNPSLLPSQFYVCAANRPMLIVNANMQEDDREVDPPQIPVQATARATGIAGQSPDGAIVGGGLVESFAFASQLNGPGKAPGTAAVTLNRRYSLCDIAGCSSAFFAEYLLQYINKGIDDIVNELVARHHLPGWAVKLLEGILEALVDSASIEVLPQYSYWPLSEVGKPAPQSPVYGFTDGGTFDNSGILGLLAQTDANRIVAFVNTETPLAEANGQIVVDTSIPLLFGSAYPAGGGPYVSFGGMNPAKPMSYVQVFDNANGELDALCRGLYEASCGGANQDSDLGSDPACFSQTLTTVENPVANIHVGRQVTVLWIYNNRVNSWQSQIGDSGLQADLVAGQSNQNPNGTLINPSGTGTGPLANFPHYYTVNQIHLSPEAVNMLAQLSAWNVQQALPQIASLLGPASGLPANAAAG